MVIAMYLAHLVGDYVLQPDRLAAWKSRELSGVLVHGSIVFATTWLFMLPFDGRWWAGLLIIGGGHILIDVAHFVLLRRSTYFRHCLTPLKRFALDQALHITLITLALASWGYLSGAQAAAAAYDDLLVDSRLWYYALGYAFITMPAWVLIKYVAGSLFNRPSPDFTFGPNKYLGIAERLLLATLIASDKFLLVPLVAAAPLLIYRPSGLRRGTLPIYVAEVLTSIILATVVGLWLRSIS